MKIAIVWDKPRVSVLVGREGEEEDKQKKVTLDDLKLALSEEYEVIDLLMDEDIIEKLKGENIDLVFNLSNGIRGEAKLSQLPSFLEFAGIPYTSSNPIGHMLASNKIYSGEIFKALKIDTPKFEIIKDLEQIKDIKLQYPILVKPKDEGSSRGIRNENLVYNVDDLRSVTDKILTLYNPPLMLMEFIDGREFSVGIIGNGKNLRVLPILEVGFSGLPSTFNKIFSFEIKMDFYHYLTYDIPAKIDEATKKLIEDTAVRAYNALEIKDYSRIDIRLKDGKAYVLDVNSLPGLEKKKSNICLMAYKVDLTYSDLVKEIVNSARARYNI